MVSARCLKLQFVKAAVLDGNGNPTIPIITSQ